MSDAIKAGAEAMEDAAMRLIGRDLGTIHRDRIFREGLDAATADVEAMARVLARAVDDTADLYDGTHSVDYIDEWEEGAQALRDWLLKGEG